MRKRKVVVGMSGGVDSSVAAYLLKEQGYDVIGINMKMWDNNQDDYDRNCCSATAALDARHVCDMLDIPFYVFNFQKEFRKNVIDYFIREYKSGKTPNPCIACNRFVKWESLLIKALSIGADYIATGHYAKVEKYPPTGRYALKISEDAEKDQTYALYNLNQEQLSKTIMPLGEYNKTRVREIAKDIGLNVANKQDSQEICFIPDKNYAKFIEENTTEKTVVGNFVDMNGNVLGKHKGIIHYTIGQRKGLGMSFGKHMYVHSINAQNNEVTLADDEDIFSKIVLAENLNFATIENVTEKMRVKAKIRYNQKMADCTIELNGKQLCCEFNLPQRAVTPGQALVLYQDDYVMGGGIIIKGEK